MKRIVTAFTLMISAGLMAGCTRTQAPAAGGPPATSRELSAAREKYARIRPGTIVGSITAVLGEERLVAVGGVPAAQFFINDTLSIIDSREKTLAFGSVVRLLPETDTVHVRYDPQPNARPPAVGDLVIRFPR